MAKPTGPVPEAAACWLTRDMKAAQRGVAALVPPTLSAPRQS